jgi:hypothetical protein
MLFFPAASQMEASDQPHFPVALLFPVGRTTGTHCIWGRLRLRALSGHWGLKKDLLHLIGIESRSFTPQAVTTRTSTELLQLTKRNSIALCACYKTLLIPFSCKISLALPSTDNSIHVYSCVVNILRFTVRFHSRYFPAYHKRHLRIESQQNYPLGDIGSRLLGFNT